MSFIFLLSCAPVVEVSDGVEVAVEPLHVVRHDALGQDAEVLGLGAQQLLHAAAHGRQQVVIGVLHDAVVERPAGEQFNGFGQMAKLMHVCA